MLNLKKLFQADKSQVATSNLKKLYQSQELEKLSDTEAQSIQGGSSLSEHNCSDPNWPFPNWPFPPGNIPGGWSNDEQD